MTQEIRNIGILAHVDAGKTTLTEMLLFQTGSIRAAGRVDQGTAHTDALAVERERGISVRSSAACVTHRNVQIRIIDTPGHVDFSTEVESALMALDGAVLVISAVEGVQPQTSVIYNVLRALGIPTLAFINKTDRAGADVARVMEQLSTLMPCAFRVSSGAEQWEDCLTRYDESLIEAALGGALTDALQRDGLRRACGEAAIVPVLEGAALKGEGVADVLDAIVDYLPPPRNEDALSAVCYHVAFDGNERQLSLRVFGGKIAFGESYDGMRVRRLRRLTPDGYQNAPALEAGDIGVAVGLDHLKAGHWLGKARRERPRMAQPVLRARVELKKPEQIALLQSALDRMSDEWPELNPRFEPRTRQFWVQVMGEIHREVIAQTLRDTYGVETDILPPGVLYRETPTKAGAGRLDMFFSPWYARAAFEVRPGPRGGGVRFESVVSTDDLYLKYQRDIESAVYQALKEGVFGWPVDDIVVTLTEGYCIRITRPGSHFAPVVPLGLFQALSDADMRLMEPILSFEITAPSNQSSKILYDLDTMRAEYEPPVFTGALLVVRGRVPAETCVHYATRLSGLTGGLGVFRTAFYGYALCPPGAGAPIERITPNPLEHDLYMKTIRGVIQ